MLLRSSSLIIALILMIPCASIAEVPRLLHFQGALADGDGLPPSGNHTATFSIYVEAAGGTALWSETAQVTVEDGLFTVTLGLGEDLAIDFSEQYWLGVQVGSDDEMEPRYRLASAPYSLWTAVSDSAISTNWAGISGVPAGFADGVDDVGAIGDGHSLDAADGEPVDALFVNNAGNVGLGTTTPGAELEVSSNSPTFMLTSTSSPPEILLSTQGASAYDWKLKVLGNDLIVETSSDDGTNWSPLMQFDGSGVDRGSFYIYNGFGTFATNRIFEFDAFDADGRCIWGDKTFSSADLVLKSNDDVKVHLQGNASNSFSSFEIINPSGVSVFMVDDEGDAWATGELNVGGSKSAVVTTDSYGERKLYAVESPEVWFEDFGSARLIDGSVTVDLEPVFASTVNLEEGYRVYVTPVDGWASLYVTNKSTSSFDVADAEGRSGVAFDYRVVAKRSGYEDVRLEELVRRKR